MRVHNLYDEGLSYLFDSLGDFSSLFTAGRYKSIKTTYVTYESNLFDPYRQLFWGGTPK